MDDLQFGKRDKRGDWSPNQALENAPVFVWPWRPIKFLRWLPNYFLPWNALFFMIAAVFWYFLTPARDTLQSLQWSWVLYLFARNSAIVILLYSVWSCGFTCVAIKIHISNITANSLPSILLMFSCSRARILTTSFAHSGPASRFGRHMRWCCSGRGQMAGDHGQCSPSIRSGWCALD